MMNYNKLFTFIFTFALLLFWSLSSVVATSPGGTHTEENVLLWEDFQDSYSIPDGWTALDHNGDGYNWEIEIQWTENDYSESLYDDALHMARSYSLYDEEQPTIPLNPDNWLITPQLTLSQNSYGITFQRMASNAGSPAEKYDILVSATGNQPDDFNDVLFSETIDEGAVWEDIFVALEGFPEQDIHIAFRHYDCYGQGRLMINDVKVYQLSSFEMFVNKITDDLHVLAGGQENYYIHIQNRGTENDTYNLSLTAGSWYTLSQQTLEVPPGETGIFHVIVSVPEGAEMGETDQTIVSLSSQGNPDLTQTLDINTTAITPVSADYMEDFNGVQEPNLPLGWQGIIQSSSPFARVATSSEKAFSPPNAVFLNNANDPAASLYLVTPKITNDLSDLRVSFYAAKTFQWVFPVLKIGTITDPSDPETFNEMETFFFTLEFDHYSFHFENYEGNDQYIAFKHDPLNEHDAGIYIDNIYIEEVKPYDLLVANLTGNMSIYAGETESYEIKITNNGLENDTYTLTIDTEETWEYAFPSTVELNAGQSQVINLSVSVPGDTDFGEISEATLMVCSQNDEQVSANIAISTTALNTIIGFPYVEEFELGFPPLGWEKVTTYEGAAWGQSNQQSFSGSFSASASTDIIFNNYMDHVADEWLIAPIMDFNQEGASALSFFGKSQNSPDGMIEILSIYALDEPHQNGDDLREYGNLIEEVFLNNYWSSHLVDLSHLEGNKYIALNFYLTGEDDADSNTIFIDDFSVGEFSSFSLNMEIPEGEGNVFPAAGNYSYLEGEVVLLQATPALGWNFSHWEGNVADAYAAETNVTMNEDNQVKAFFLQMEGESLPFTEDFSETEMHEIPENWFRSHSNWSISDTDHAGGQAPEIVLAPFPMTNGNLRLITPPLDLRYMAEAEMSFNTFIEDGPWADYTLKVQTSLDGNTWEDTGWEYQPSQNLETEGPQYVNIDLDHLAGEEQVFIAWVFTGMTIDLEQWAIDDIVVEGVPEEVLHSVVFEVVDEDAVPIEHAVISLGEVINPAGNYHFENIEAGIYDYTVEKEGFISYTGEDLHVTEDISLTITLARDEVNVHGSFNETINIFPNPASTSLHISSISKLKSIKLFDITGSLLQTIEVNGRKTVISVDHLPNGVYLVSVERSGMTVTQRIVIAR